MNQHEIPRAKNGMIKSKNVDPLRYDSLEIIINQRAGKIIVKYLKKLAYFQWEK